MPQNPPEGYPSVMPYLLYEDSDAALEFLVNALGFTEKLHVTGDDGRVNHAEVQLSDGVIMFGTPPGDYKNPAKLERAKQAGAKIVRQPEDQVYGDRNYGVEDPEGHEWYFGTHVRDVSTEEMQAAGATS